MSIGGSTDHELDASVAEEFLANDIEEQIVDGGIHYLINRGLTPEQAMIEDVQYLHDLLARNEIRCLLVRGDSRRPVVAIDAEDRARLERVLRSIPVEHCVYVRGYGGKKSEQQSVHGDFTFDARSSSHVLYRPRTSPGGDLVYGAAFGVQIEFWDYLTGGVLLPNPTAITRADFSLAETRTVRAERYGRSWFTLEGMFDRLVTDVDFDIDMVFSWVDGNDRAVKQQWVEALADAEVGEGDDAVARIRQINELKYALRSVYMYAPWVRKIFIATDSTPPAWLADHPQVEVVRSEQFFSDPEALPTNNSHAVESQLHKIPGLSEYFLYSNDDMFFGRPMRPSDFFSSGGVSKFLLSHIRVGIGQRLPERSGHENAARKNRELLRTRFGVLIDRHLEHVAVPMRRSIAAELEAEFPDEFARTAQNRFRHYTDISVTNSLYHYFSLVTGKAVTTKKQKVIYVDTTTRTGLKRMEKLLPGRKVHMFCLNDGSYPEVTESERRLRVQSLLERYYPFPAPWEKPEIDE